MTGHHFRLQGLTAAEPKHNPVGQARMLARDISRQRCLRAVRRRPLPEILHDHIRSQIGAECDAFILVDPRNKALVGSGLAAKVFDLVRFRNMIVQKAS